MANIWRGERKYAVGESPLQPHPPPPHVSATQNNKPWYKYIFVITIDIFIIKLIRIKKETFGVGGLFQKKIQYFN